MNRIIHSRKDKNIWAFFSVFGSFFQNCTIWAVFPFWAAFPFWAVFQKIMKYPFWAVFQKIYKLSVLGSLSKKMNYPFWAVFQKE